MFNDRPGSTNPTLVNCSFQGNSAVQQGGAYYESVLFNLRNCVFFGNGGSNTLYTSSASQGTRVTNCLFDNTVTGYPSDPTNLATTTSPFVSTTTTQLVQCAPAINTGSTANYNTFGSAAATDLAGNPRFYNNSNIDMGAYEFQGEPFFPLSITAQPAASMAVCAGSAVTASVSVTGTITGYQWYKDGVSLTGIVSATLSIPTATTADAGSYSVVITGACNSVTSTAFSLTVNTLPIPNLSGNLTICNGTSTTLTAGGGNGGATLGFAWSSGQPTSAIVVSPTSTTAYSVTVTNTTTGCFASTSALVTVNPALTATLAGNLTICNGSSTTLTASGGNGFGWSGGQNTSAVVVAPTSTTAYSVTVTNTTTGCFASTSVTVTVNPLPLVALSSSNVCAGGIVSLSATSGLSSYTFTGPGTLTGSGNTRSVAALSVGSYSFSVVASNTNGCLSTATTSVTVNAFPNPTLTASPSATLTCPLASLTLTAGGADGYSFSGPGLVSQSGNLAVVNVSGLYSVTVTNTTTGCASTTSITISSNLSGSFSTIKAGPWNDPTVWSCGVVPTASSAVMLNHAVSLPTGYSAQCQLIRYGSVGQLVYQTGATVQIGF